MLKIEAGSNPSFFRVNGKPYQRGGYEAIITGTDIEIERIAGRDKIVARTPLANQIAQEFNRAYRLFTDFANSLLGDGSLTFTSSASGGSTTSVYEAFVDSIDAVARPRIGLIQFRSGATSGNQIAYTWFGVTLLSLVSLFRELSIRLSFRLQGGLLPSSVANYGFYLGFHNNFTGANYLITTERYAVVRIPLISEANTYQFEYCNAGGASTIVDLGISFIGNSFEDFQVALKTTGGVRRFEVSYFGSVILTVSETGSPNFPSNNGAQQLTVGFKIRNLGGTVPA